MGSFRRSRKGGLRPLYRSSGRIEGESGGRLIRGEARSLFLKFGVRYAVDGIALQPAFIDQFQFLFVSFLIHPLKIAIFIFRV